MGLLQSLIRVFLPEEGKFYDYIEHAAAAADEAARLFGELARIDGRDARLVLVERIREAEHMGDKAKKEMADALDATFVTPIDREDLFHLVGSLESVSDFISATSNHLTVHQMDSLPDGTRELSDVLGKATHALVEAVALLRQPDRYDKARALCQSVHYLEHEGDVIFRLRLGDLFAKEKDAIQLIKHKEFLEGLEDSIDRCAGAATVIEAVCIKHA